jgi:hypothetical protein
VRIAVHHGQMPSCAVAVGQALAGRDRALVDLPTIRGQPIAELIREPGEAPLGPLEPVG